MTSFVVVGSLRRAERFPRRDSREPDTITPGDPVLFDNPYLARRWHNEEIAISTLDKARAAGVRGDGPPPYPLAGRASDYLGAPAVEESAETGTTVTTGVQAWA